MKYYRSKRCTGLYASFEYERGIYSGHVIVGIEGFANVGDKIAVDTLIGWKDVTPEAGQIYLKGGIEYRLEELRDQEVYLTYFDVCGLPCYVSPTYAEFFAWWELCEEIDDCSSYTEGYRAGYSGLRWL